MYLLLNLYLNMVESCYAFSSVGLKDLV